MKPSLDANNKIVETFYEYDETERVLNVSPKGTKLRAKRLIDPYSMPNTTCTSTNTSLIVTYDNILRVRCYTN